MDCGSQNFSSAPSNRDLLENNRTNKEKPTSVGDADIADADFSSMVVAQFRRKLSQARWKPIGGLRKALSEQGQLITADDLHMALKRLGLHLKQNECHMLFNAIDQDGIGELSVDEVLQTLGDGR